MATQHHQLLLVYGYIRNFISSTNNHTKFKVIYDTILKYSERKHITIGLFGSFRTGKSTLGGRMCYEFNHQHHTSNESVVTNNNSNAYSEQWSTYFDHDEEEQLRKMTIHGNINEIYTLSYIISLIDTPGYKQYIKNFLRYISQCDIVILVFAATDIIEKYQSNNNMPSTPRMDRITFNGYYELLNKLRICHLFEIKQIIIAINKLDKFNYSKHKFYECKTEIEKLLKTVGFTYQNQMNKNKFCFIPISAINGDNIFHKSTNNKLKWWNTMPSTIYDSIEYGININNIKMYKDNIINIKPFKLSICNIYDETLRGSILSGRIESGRISVGTIIKCFPSGCYGQIKSIEMFKKKSDIAMFGDIIGIELHSFLLHPQRGDVIINENNTKQQNNFGDISTFEALVNVYPSNDKINKKYKNGFSPVIHTNNSIKQCQCKMIHIIWKINKNIKNKTNNNKFKQKDENAKYLEAGDTAKVIFEPNRQFAIALSQKIVVLEHKQMIMSGKVLKLHYTDEIIEDLK